MTHLSIAIRIITATSAARSLEIQVNLDMTDSMGPGQLVCHMQNPSYTYDEYLICIRLGPNISVVQWSVISKFTYSWFFLNTWPPIYIDERDNKLVFSKGKGYME